MVRERERDSHRERERERERKRGTERERERERGTEVNSVSIRVLYYVRRRWIIYDMCVRVRGERVHVSVGCVRVRCMWTERVNWKRLCA